MVRSRPVPVDPAALSALADRLEAAGRAAKERGEGEGAIAMYEAALTLKAMVAPETADKLLKQGKYSPRVTGMDAEHRLAISKGRSRKNPLMRAARAAGIRDVAHLREKLEAHGYKVSAAFLSMVGTGVKPAPADLLKALGAIGVAYEP